jgi:MFS family permease
MPLNGSEPSKARILAALYLCTFASLLGAGLVAPLLPVYARHHGAGGFVIGAVFAAFSLSRTCLLPFFGRLSDRRGRRDLILTGLAIYTACTIIFILSPNPYYIILGRLIQGGAAAMIWPIAAAYVGDLTPPGQEGAYMGRFNLATFSGLACGPFLGGLIKDLAGIDAAFMGMGVMTLAGLAVAWAFLPQEESFRPKPPSRTLRTVRLLLSDKILRGMFLFRFIYSVCVSLTWAFQPILLDSSLGLPSSWIGLLVSLNVGAAAILQAPLGKLADRYSRPKLIQTGALIQALALSALPFARTIPSLLAVNLTLGVAAGFFLPALQAIATDLGRRRQTMGAVMSVLLTGQSLGMLVGPMLGGGLYEVIGIRTIFLVASGLALTSLVPVLAYLKTDRVAASLAGR